MKETCGQCKFFDGGKACRRFPPVYVEKIERNLRFSFPTVYEGGWCGEFKIKASKKDWYAIFGLRIGDALKRADIKTLPDLKSRTDAQLMGIKNLGRKSFDEIKKYLAEQRED